MPNQLPEFERPPVSEFAMGVQFDPLPNFHAAHLGLFWSRIRAEYPLTEDQTPVAPSVEPAELKPSPVTVQAVAYAVPPLPRCWFLNKDKTELIQVQHNGFWRNWRQIEGKERYPHFSRLAADFHRAWGGFLAFAGEQELGPVKVNQCEISYVNRIERGVGWNELGVLDRVFTILRPSVPGSFLPPPEILTWQARYKLPEGRGRLHVEMTPAFGGPDLKLILSLNLTARGAPAGGSPEQIAAWFDLAHEWAVRGFVELTGSAAHELWGMK
jgi:uncharacterized protein (TIGR04255 family)